MKQVKPFLLSFLSIFLIVACDNEPIDFTERAAPDPEPEIDLIVGDWNLNDVTISDATASFNAGGIPVTVPVTGDGSEYDLQLTFTEENMLNATGSYLQSVSLSLGPQTIDQQQVVQASDLLTTGTWTRTTALLTVDNGTETQELNILELDEEVLILQITLTQTQEINEIPAEIMGTLTLTFNRL